MAIAAFVDAPVSQQDLAVELAITLAEYSIEENQPLYLLVDAVTALEIGLSLLGSRASRTAEGGEYRASPLQLLPFIPRPDWRDGESLRETPDQDAGGDISELYGLGLFARADERAVSWDPESEPASAFSQIIATARPRQIVGLGEASEYWSAISDGIERSPEEYIPQIVMVDGFGPERFEGRFERREVQAPALTPLRSADDHASREVDELERLRIAAERDGALVAGLLDFLTRQARGGRATR